MSLSVRSSARFGTTHQKNSYFCEFAMYNNNPHSFKGQIISECPYEKIVYPKIATKKFPRFLSWPLRRGHIKKIKALQGCTKGQKSGGAGSNGARRRAGGAFWSAKIIQHKSKMKISGLDSSCLLQADRLPIRGECWFSSVTTFQNNFFLTNEILNIWLFS